jgi:hypothetical protein
MAHHLGAAKVGDDIPLTCKLVDESNVPLNLEQAHVTIVHLKTGKRVASERSAIVDGNIARAVWTPLSPGDYAIEWHLEHSGGIDKYTEDAMLAVLPRWALVSAPIGPTTPIGLIEGSATGAVLVTGTHVATLGPIAQSASATIAEIRVGTQNASIGDIAQSADADVLVRGTHSALIASPVQAADGTVHVTGSHAASVGAISQAAAGVVPVIGAQNVPVGFVTQSATGTVADVFVGLIDNIVAAGGSVPNFSGCSSHRLYSLYSGALITVERSDGATQAIGYSLVTNRLDEVALATFCGALDGFIRTLHDQGGLGRDVTQTDRALQPKIYDGATGQVVKQGTLPWMTQTAAGAGLSRGDSAGITGAVAVSFAYFVAFTTASSDRIAMAVGNNTGFQRFDAGINGANPRVRISNGNHRSFTAASAVTGSHFYVASIGAGAQVGTATVRQNGTLLSESAVALGTATTSIGTAALSVLRNVGAAQSVSGGGCFFMADDVEWTGAVLAAIEAFGATLSTLD